MKKGEKGILVVMGLAIVITAVVKGYGVSTQKEKDKGIPYYTTASQELSKKARSLFAKYQCHDCHSLWTKRSMRPSADKHGRVS